MGLCVCVRHHFQRCKILDNSMSELLLGFTGPYNHSYSEGYSKINEEQKLTNKKTKINSLKDSAFALFLKSKRLEHSKYDGGPGHHHHLSCPLDPLGPCLTHFMSHAKNTWLVLQGRVCQHFGIWNYGNGYFDNDNRQTLFLGTGGASKTDSILEKVPRGGVIFNPKKYIAGFGAFKYSFLSMKLE